MTATSSPGTNETMCAGTTSSAIWTESSPKVATCFAVTILTFAPETATIVPAPTPRSRSVNAVTTTAPSASRSGMTAVAALAGAGKPNQGEPNATVRTAANATFTDQG
jgi:hypothetical protein